MSRHHIWVPLAGGLLTSGLIWWWLHRGKPPADSTGALEVTASTGESLARIASALEHIAGASYVSFDAAPPSFEDVDMGPAVGPEREAPKLPTSKKTEGGKKGGDGASKGQTPTLATSEVSQEHQDAPSQPAEMKAVTESTYEIPSPSKPKVRVDTNLASERASAKKQKPLEGTFSSTSSAPHQDSTPESAPLISSSEYAQSMDRGSSATPRVSPVRATRAAMTPSVPRARFK